MAGAAEELLECYCSINKMEVKKDKAKMMKVIVKTTVRVATKEKEGGKGQG